MRRSSAAPSLPIEPLRVAPRKHESLAEELRRLVAEIGRCRLAHIRPGTKLREDLGIDSFTGTEILVALEQRYGLKITETEANHIVTFQEMVEFIERRLQSR